MPPQAADDVTREQDAHRVSHTLAMVGGR
jgi:hypothetical protein